MNYERPQSVAGNCVYGRPTLSETTKTQLSGPNKRSSIYLLDQDASIIMHQHHFEPVKYKQPQVQQENQLYRRNPGLDISLPRIDLSSYCTLPMPPPKPKRAQSNVRFDDNVQAFSNSNCGSASDNSYQSRSKSDAFDSVLDTNTPRSSCEDVNATPGYTYNQMQSQSEANVCENESLYVNYYKASLQKANSTLLSNRGSYNSGRNSYLNQTARSASYNMAANNKADLSRSYTNRVNHSCISVDSGISYNPNNTSYNIGNWRRRV